jgi:heme/copper-type cytochrome/quinol oxidase subunit 3
MMTTIPLPLARTGRAEAGRWAMLLFLVNEATLFGCLVASYFYLGFVTHVWPPSGVERPALALPLIMTALLLSSSVALVAAEAALKRRKPTAYRAGVVVAIGLGAGFLALQLVEYHDKLGRLHPSDNAYASLFYTITGLHGTHVAFGLLFLAWALARESTGTASPSRSVAIRNSSLYWHFVDAVWLVILTSLYLSPRW